MDESEKWVRNQGVFFSQIDQDVVMMDEKAGLYFGLNPVAGKIWALLEKPLSFSALLDKLTTVYAVSRETCQHDLKHFLKEMQKHQLVSPVF